MTEQNQKPSQISVLIVDDSAFMRTALSRMIASEPDLRVAGTARDGADALLKIPALDPDVITLDVDMPGLNGVETLRTIMARCPRPVIMVSSVTMKGAEETFDALSAGAFDYIPKQLSPNSLDIIHIRRDLVEKIKTAARSRNQSEKSISRKPPRLAASQEAETQPFIPAIVAMGTSTGGPQALQEILPALRPDLSVPVLVVQHMPVGFTAPFAQRLNSMCSVPVREAVHGEPLLPGVVYIAPAGLHMTVERRTETSTVVCLSKDQGNSLHMPSVDILMQSVAVTYQNLAMGVIMTGMGTDGTVGMSAIYRAGGFTLGQDEATCAVYGMPKACAELGLLKRIVPLPEIPRQILQAARYRKRA
jgi:two-component system, chemotaxis family, protein-glutamate methylesterase/glutaminase